MMNRCESFRRVIKIFLLHTNKGPVIINAGGWAGRDFFQTLPFLMTPLALSQNIYGPPHY